MTTDPAHAYVDAYAAALHELQNHPSASATSPRRASYDAAHAVFVAAGMTGLFAQRHAEAAAADALLEMLAGLAAADDGPESGETPEGQESVIDTVVAAFLRANTRPS